MFGWSPQRAEIENKQADLRVIEKAIGDMASVKGNIASAKDSFTNLGSQISTAYRVSGDSADNYMVTRIVDTADQASAKLNNMKTELQEEIRYLEGQEQVYLENQRRLREQAAKAYEESLTKSNLFL